MLLYIIAIINYLRICNKKLIHNLLMSFVVIDNLGKEFCFMSTIFLCPYYFVRTQRPFILYTVTYYFYFRSNSKNYSNEKLN